MMWYVLIGLSLSLAGVAGLQFFYMAYLERLDREHKKRIRELERHTKATGRLAIENGRAHVDEVREGSEQSQMTTVSGVPLSRVASRACRPAAAAQCVMSSVEKPRIFLVGFSVLFLSSSFSTIHLPRLIMRR